MNNSPFSLFTQGSVSDSSKRFCMREVWEDKKMEREVEVSDWEVTQKVYLVN